MSLESGATPEVSAEDIRDYIEATFEGVVVMEAMHATFFSCNEQGWPNFATIVTTYEHDEGNPSDLARPGVFRLNIGLGPASFRRAVGAQLDPDAKGYVPRADLDYAVLDTLLPHPVYAAQRWACILNPSRASFETVVKPLLAEAHAIVWRRESKARPK